jgi:hypothetical protein
VTEKEFVLPDALATPKVTPNEDVPKNPPEAVILVEVPAEKLEPTEVVAPLLAVLV